MQYNADISPQTINALTPDTSPRSKFINVSSDFPESRDKNTSQQESEIQTALINHQLQQPRISLLDRVRQSVKETRDASQYTSES